MKRQFPLAFGLILVLAAFCLAQEATPSPAPKAKPRPAMNKAQLQTHLIGIEKKLWEAWKNKDSKPFKMYLSADTVSVSQAGVEGREASIKAIESSDCVVRSYDLSDFKLTVFDSDAAMLTYKGAQDATCSGTTIPANIWASSLYVKRAGKWLAASHQETPAQ